MKIGLSKKKSFNLQTNIRNKFLDRIISIVDIDSTFFVSKKIPGNVKIDRNIIELNYSHLSPFENSGIIYFKDNKTNMLYLWFRKNSPKTEKRIYIPEGFLIFNKFRKEKECVIIQKKGDIYNIVIIKKESLISQFSTTSKNKSGLVDMIKKEHSLDNPKIIETEYDENIKHSINIVDVLLFFHVYSEINAKKILESIYEKSKVPFIVVLVIMNIANLTLYSYTNNLIKRKSKELKILERKNAQVKKQFDYMENQANFFTEFSSQELSFPSILEVLNSIGKCIKDNKGALIRYEEFYNRINLWVVSSSISEVVNSLVSTGIFDNIKVISISPSFRYKGKKVGNLSLILKSSSNIKGINSE